ncbi:ABC transporter permease [Pseudaestuariivita atlantica]|uniref:ABC transporter permease n=1 Tax=Pseudaestuariivita atlantica TaxID=1317121 RepID=UPI003BF7D7E5
MGAWKWLVYLLLVIAGGYGFRAAGQAMTGNAPFYRDMTLAVAVGYVFAAVVAIAVAYTYSISFSTAGGMPDSYFFFRLAIHGLAAAVVAAILFRQLGMWIGTPGSRKLFRQMPGTAAFGIFIILCYAIAAIFAAWIAPYGQEEVLAKANIIPLVSAEMGGDPGFPLGTDQIGRDIYSRLIYGAQNTVGIAFVTTILAFFLGVTGGFLAAVLQGWTDQVLSRLVDVLMAIPALIFSLLLITAAASLFKGSSLTVAMIVIIAVIDSTRVFRLARAVGMNIVVMDYIEAAKLRGERMSYLIFREVLPNAYAPLLAEFGLRFCFVFLTIAALSFLGLGIQPPLADWGTMVKDLGQFVNYAAFLPQYAMLPLLPAGAIALLTVAVNFVVDWMLHRSSGLKE